MDKQLIERIALEVANSLSAPYVSDESAVRFATEFLARIDAERGKSAVAMYSKTYDRAYTKRQVGFDNEGGIPLFLSPTPIPEGMVLVSKRLLTDHDYKWLPEDMALVPIELTEAMVQVSGAESQPGKCAYDVAAKLWADMLAAAQGEQK